MEIFRAVESVVGKLSYVIEQDKKLTSIMKRDLRSIKSDMAMMNAYIMEVSSERNVQDAIEEQWILQLQNLAYDMEDSIDNLYRKPEIVLFFPRVASMLTGKDHRPEFIGEIKSFKDRVVDLRDWKSKVDTTQTRRSGNNGLKNGYLDPAASASLAAGSAHGDLVGIDRPQRELLELLLSGEAAAEGEAEKLRVVSIVGLDGLGKTTLAKAVFDSPDVDDRRFPCRVWVVASEHRDTTELLTEILRQVGGGTSETTSNFAQLGKNLRTYLEKTRYFIVIDDMRHAEVWGNIESAFPRNNTGSRIIVTTSTQSVSTVCSHGSYVYRMQGLGRNDSQRLFWNKVFGDGRTLSPDLVKGSEGIINKCDGLPLALVSIAQFLRPKGLDLTGRDCKRAGRALANHLAGADVTFEEMKRALVQCYNSLPGHGDKTCLLSVSMFPRGHWIKRKSLLRRWLAEGLVVRDVRLDEKDVARDRFEKLIDRSIVDPVQISNNSEVKRCQVHGVMLEFIVHKSISGNFITLIHNGELVGGDNGACVRRLSIQNSTEEDAIMAMEKIGELSHVRSLTIVRSNLFDFQECKLMRVLDLENCTGLTDDVLDKICKLLHLKYLSLRGTDVSEIPRKIAKLEFLETMDIRETGVQILPLEVITLPSLLHLFGEFDLPCELKNTWRKKRDPYGLSSSKLQTLAGFVMDRGFEQIIRRMKSLRKVKIWCKSSTTTDSEQLLVSSLQTRFTGNSALESLSIDFGTLSIDFLNSLRAPSMLSSIKLRGILSSLPDFITSLEFLSELHLFSTGLSSEALSDLQRLPCLVYLRLVEDLPEFWDGNFAVRSDGFPSLHRLCFQAPKLPRVQIEQGAMSSLTSLHLLCPEYSAAAAEIEEQLGVTDISHLEHLDEVVLHSSVTEPKMQAWKAAAMRHKNRPAVKKQPTA